LNPAHPFEVYPFKELVLFAFLSALGRLRYRAQTEAESTPGNPVVPAETKPKHGKKRNLTGSKGVSTLKSGSENGLPPQAAEFMNLPPQIREQLLRYGARWAEAMFEPRP
jgi:hypothetical protein